MAGLSAIGDNLFLVCIATNITKAYQVPVEEVYMSAIYNNERAQEVSAEVEVEEVLIEVGKVSETKGGIFGVTPDIGNGVKQA